MGADDQKVLLGTDAGYGFVAKIGDLYTKNTRRQGRGLTAQGRAEFSRPKMVNDANAQIAAVTNEGRLLVFPIAELPELAKGKGNKIINIPRLATTGPRRVRYRLRCSFYRLIHLWFTQVSATL